mmetsp:Transcript_35128/g.84783  ORF Transcript_35128/g.84783 Transcript_35128/m.84783 type:complete len:227 (+) Transcript_35128:237-917(+)|eukprot:CAMPEP_0181118502 /NCGR_PEP_ID=MMETSP1071-20121207/23111_1 /TAXON_ID=35127 /ORGANISM="Thalassiosira sp., Strain NH16" /LENGTH=226 /DNA_ID=CAMNT_0023203003 /DNA_START=233 /DNA_END=913 /DNA_ORIENTATION=-
MGLFSSNSRPKADGRNNKLRNSTGSAKLKKSLAKKKRVQFTDIAAQKIEYEFDWDLEPEYWYNKEELKSFNEVRFDEAATLRKERSIRTASRNDADALSSSKRNVFIGDKITNALDDIDDNGEISIRGIEHFVFPVLQKEMVTRKKELKKGVLMFSRDPSVRRLDPKGIKLAEQTVAHSQWARDVATERGMKYCQMKRGAGRGGGLLSMSKNTKTCAANRRLMMAS